METHLITKILSGLLILLIVTLQYRVWYGEGGTKQIEDFSRKIEQQRQQNDELISQIKKLKIEINLLRNKPEVLEEKAREQLGLVKKDEIFYRVIPSE